MTPSKIRSEQKIKELGYCQEVKALWGNDGILMFSSRYF